ncbi:MAG: hypothetical protein RIQ56_686 [Candidatus Parcubacteria bacterium]|jgi:hypothetical protein
MKQSQEEFGVPHEFNMIGVDAAQIAESREPNLMLARIAHLATELRESVALVAIPNDREREAFLRTLPLETESIRRKIEEEFSGIVSADTLRGYLVTGVFIPTIAHALETIENDPKVTYADALYTLLAKVFDAASAVVVTITDPVLSKRAALSIDEIRKKIAEHVRFNKVKH